MEVTTSSVAGLIAPITQLSQEQSRAADEVSSSAAELAAQITQMDATAHELSVHADGLTELVGAFRTARLAAAPERPALVGAAPLAIA
jgi:methyl-accepting chemotaxis protein